MEKLNAYESFLVVDATKTKEQIDEIVSKFRELIKSNATLDGEDVWGRRRLAYEINHKTEGFYVLFYFTCEGSFPAELERQYRITDGVLRFLVVRNEDGFKPDLTKSLAPRDGVSKRVVEEKKAVKTEETPAEPATEEVVEETKAEEVVAEVAVPETVEEAPVVEEVVEEKPKAKKATTKKATVKKDVEEVVEKKPAKKTTKAKKAESEEVVEEKPKAKKTVAKKTAKEEEKDAE